MIGRAIAILKRWLHNRSCPCDVFPEYDDPDTVAVKISEGDIPRARQ